MESDRRSSSRDGGHAGWGVVAAAATLMAVTSGVWYSGSVLFVPLLAEFGRDYAVTSAIFSLFTLLTGVFGILSGHLVDRWSARRIILVGGVLLFCGHALSSLAAARWHLFFTHSILTSLGVACMGWTPVSVHIARTFHERRGLILGIASAGVGIGLAVFVPFTQAVIDYAGWRMAFLALGSTGTLLVLPAAWFAFRQAEIPSAPAGASRTAARAAQPRDERASDHGLGAALSSRTFWLAAGTFGCLSGPVQLLMTHQVTHLVEAGQPALFAAGIVGLVGLVSTLGKIFWGWLSDRWWLESSYLVAISILGLGVAVLLSIGPGSARGMLYIYAMLFGFGYAVSPTLSPVMSARFFSGPHFGIIFGALHTAHLGGGAVGVWIAGYVHDLAGNYRPALLGCYLSLCLAILFAWLAAPRRLTAKPAAERIMPRP
jgi:MFS family permease